jgi:chromosome segregation ATPase
MQSQTFGPRRSEGPRFRQSQEIAQIHPVNRELFDAATAIAPTANHRDLLTVDPDIARALLARIDTHRTHVQPLVDEAARLDEDTVLQVSDLARLDAQLEAADTNAAHKKSIYEAKVVSWRNKLSSQDDEITAITRTTREHEGQISKMTVEMAKSKNDIERKQLKLKKLAPKGPAR